MVSGRFVALEVAPGLHRFELPASVLEVPPPPVYTELTLQPAGNGWRVTALAGRQQQPLLEAWLQALGATRLHYLAKAKEPVLAARLAALPRGLRSASDLLDVRQVGLGSDGSAFVLAAAAKGKFDEFVRSVEAQRMPENAVPELTARQAELLQFCKDRGYYEIPRQVTLRQLASDLGISPTALSKALRRAEARILSAYVERLRHAVPRAPPRRNGRPE